jgi:hypothetical protein
VKLGQQVDNKGSSASSSSSDTSIENISLLRKMKKHFREHDACFQDLERELNNDD